MKVLIMVTYSATASPRSAGSDPILLLTSPHSHQQARTHVHRPNKHQMRIQKKRSKDGKQNNCCANSARGASSVGMRLAPYTLQGVFSRRECGSKARATQKRAPAIDICDVRMMIMTCSDGVGWQNIPGHIFAFVSAQPGPCL